MHVSALEATFPAQDWPSLRKILCQWARMDACVCSQQDRRCLFEGLVSSLSWAFYILLLLSLLLTCCIILSTEGADSCSLRCVCFLKHNEVLTGNLRGQMKVWDLKNAVNKPASTFMLSGEQVCVTVHVGEQTVVLFSRCN